MDSIPQRECAKCGNSYPLTEEFYRTNATGFRSVCKQCNRDDANRYYAENKPAVLEKKRQHRIDNIDVYTERDRRRIVENYEREQLRWLDYQNRNRDKVRQSSQTWRDNNPDKIKSYSVTYYQEHREQEKVKSRRSYLLNYPRYIAHAKKANSKRRALMAQAEGNFTASDIRNLYEDQDGLCGYCGVRSFFEVKGDVHVDHVHPLSRGGSNWPDNLCLTCESCNLSKRDKTVAEWQAVRGW